MTYFFSQKFSILKTATEKWVWPMQIIMFSDLNVATNTRFTEIPFHSNIEKSII